MKLVILLAVLLLASFFMQKVERKPVEKKHNSTSQSGNMILSAPPFDQYGLRAGEAPLADNANRKSPNNWDSKKELIVLKKISKGELAKDSLIWERNTAADSVNVNSNKFVDAKRTCQQDAEILPDHGWALIGFYNSLKGQDKIPEVESVKKRVEQTLKWSDMDTKDAGLY